jgi:transmembrane sensor
MSDLARWSLLLEKCRAEQCSPEELQELLELAAVDPARIRVIGQILPWRMSGALGRRTDATVEQDLAKVLAAHRRDRAVGQPEADPPRKRPATGIDNAAFQRAGFGYPAAQRGRGESAFRRYAHASVRMSAWRVASGVAALVGVAVAAAWLELRHTWTPVVRTYVTARGEREAAQLVDGTRIVLAPASRLVVTAAPGVGPRLLDLDGQAEMDVVHDARRPFEVHTKNAVVRDIGTSFVVRGYADDPDVRVLVTNGVVSLGTTSDAQPSTLTAGSLGVVTRAGATSVVTATAADDYLSWAQGRLVFHLTPLAQVVEELGRWYDLDISLVDADLGTVPISGALPADKMDDALDALATVAGAKWERHGHSVVLTKRHGTTEHQRARSARDAAGGTAHPQLTH